MGFELPRKTESGTEDFSELLEKKSFLEQAIVRTTPAKIEAALDEKNISKATELALKGPLSLLHQLDQMRLKDVFGVSAGSVNLNLNAVEKQVRAVWEEGARLRDTNESNEESLRSFVEHAVSALDMVEGLVPAGVREQYVSGEMVKGREWLAQNEESPRRDDAERRQKLLGGAREEMAGSTGQ